MKLSVFLTSIISHDLDLGEVVVVERFLIVLFCLLVIRKSFIKVLGASLTDYVWKMFWGLIKA